MTEQEKELIQLIKDCNNTWKHEFKTSREVDLAKSIIAHYPQVLAENIGKEWECPFIMDGETSYGIEEHLHEVYRDKEIKVYIEVQS